MSSYPEDCIQDLLGTTAWWEKNDDHSLCRGALVSTYVQFFSSIPLELTTERIDAQNHHKAKVVARPLHAGGTITAAEPLPVAGLPRLDGAHCYVVNRAKRRPCLVLGAVDQRLIKTSLIKGMSKWKGHLFFWVAPFFGVEQAARDGYNPDFVERIRHGDYRSFFWDRLPDDDGYGSILRLDQVQPVGYEHQACQHLGWRLGKQALEIMDQWLNWLIYDHLPENDLSSFRKLMQQNDT